MQGRRSFIAKYLSHIWAWFLTGVAIASIISNLPPSVQNLFLDCTAAKQSALNPYPIHLCPILRKHAVNLKSMFLSCRFLVSTSYSIPSLILVSRVIPPRVNGNLATSRRSPLRNLIICAYTLLPTTRIIHHLPRGPPRSHSPSLHRNVPLRPPSSPPSPPKLTLETRLKR